MFLIKPWLITLNQCSDLSLDWLVSWFLSFSFWFFLFSLFVGFGSSTALWLYALFLGDIRYSDQVTMSRKSNVFLMRAIYLFIFKKKKFFVKWSGKITIFSLDCFTSAVMNYVKSNTHVRLQRFSSMRTHTQHSEQKCLSIFLFLFPFTSFLCSFRISNRKISFLTFLPSCNYLKILIH